MANRTRYLRLRFSLIPATEDRFIAEVWALGCLGLEMQEADDGSPIAVVYYPTPPAETLTQLLAGRRELPGSSLLDVGEIEEEDWLGTYRELSEPLSVGRRWTVDPREPGNRQESGTSERQLLRIPARCAFGIGSHQSTRLIVELLERCSVAGKRVLDLGTGTGILAMMAMSDGARFVVGFDHDPLAVCLARSNGELNDLYPHLVAGRLEAIRTESSREWFDLVLANILPAHLRPDLPALVHCLRPTGHLLLSGLLVDQESEMVSELGALGLCPRLRRESDGWLALDLELARP